jgi:hypothetical protein
VSSGKFRIYVHYVLLRRLPKKERKMKKKLLTGMCFILIAAFALAACAPPAAEAPATEAPATEPAAAETAAPAGGGELYFLNFKPEVAEIYQKIADEYKKETGNTLKVVTAAAGTYEQTLKSEIAKADAPVLFQINGPVGYAAWKDYTADLKNTELYQHLSDKNLAVTDGDGVFGLPYVIEGYGIIYNNAIMDKYFGTEGAKAASMDEVNNFATLKAVVEDMTAKKDELGIEGVFCSTSLKPGEDWRWQTHLADVPVFYEFRDNNVDIKDPAATMEVKFQCADNFKIFLTSTSTTRPPPRLCWAARASTIPWRSLLWGNVRWCRMATGHGVRSRVLTAIRSRRKMSSSCPSIPACRVKKNNPSTWVPRTSSRSISKLHPRSRNWLKISSCGCSAVQPASLSSPTT